MENEIMGGAVFAALFIGGVAMMAEDNLLVQASGVLCAGAIIVSAIIVTG